MEIVISIPEEDAYGVIFNREELTYIKSLLGGCSTSKIKKAGFNIDNSDLYSKLYLIVGDAGLGKFIVSNNQDE